MTPGDHIVFFDDVVGVMGPGGSCRGIKARKGPRYCVMGPDCVMRCAAERARVRCGRWGLALRLGSEPVRAILALFLPCLPACLTGSERT